jgi:ParB-like chromosome segregation protein Spo0J
VGGPDRPALAAAEAARLLEDAWSSASDPLRADVVRELARSLGEEIEALADPAGRTSPDARFEAALRAADVANLAASSLADLPDEDVVRAVAAAHLAAGAARVLVTLAEASRLDRDLARYALKDAQSAAWRARFAVRQTDEFLGIEA